MSKRKKKLRSISYYLGDRKRMFEEMFNCIPQNQIQSLIPPELQGMPFGELKAELLILLLQMPEKDIVDAMEGRKVVANVTVSDDEDAAKGVVVLSDEDIKTRAKAKCEIFSDDEDILEINIEESEMKEIERNFEDADKKVKLERRKMQNRKRKKPKKESVSESDQDNTHKNKSLLELLELELRAKAIRSLLRKEQEAKNGQEQVKPHDKPIEGQETQNQNYFELVSSDEDDVIPVEEKLPEIELSSESEADEQHEEIIIEDEDNATEANDIVEQDQHGHTNGKDETDDTRQSWTDRWLDSERVKNVVATSKMLTTVRKKILSNLKGTTGKSSLDQYSASGMRGNNENGQGTSAGKEAGQLVAGHNESDRETITEKEDAQNVSDSLQSPAEETTTGTASEEIPLPRSDSANKTSPNEETENV